MNNRLSSTLLLPFLLILSACRPSTTTPTASTQETPTVSDSEPLPVIISADLDKDEVSRYESLEIIVELDAAFSNPFDQREIALSGTFTTPDGTSMTVPGFWDAQRAWRVRFTPWQDGSWQYTLLVEDQNGTSDPYSGSFTVTASEKHGWLIPGSRFDTGYSGHYLVHHDGTPFYGVGHADALNILIDGFNIDSGVGLFDNMLEADENYVVYWPMYSNPVLNSYDNYGVSNLSVIDLVVKDAQEKGIFLIFTIWDHPQLRDDTHAWDTGNWARNGFKDLVSLDQFFVDEQAWAWQENFYRYIIARWGYSPAIGMWQTVSEINGTNAYEQTDPWHERVNAYFIENDPYGHPTTASMAGDVDWQAGHLVMDAPQVHVYDLQYPVEAAETIAYWTALMFNRAEKPNWIGEFGVPGNDQYPELFHNALWAALSNGAALTPAEWNSGGTWMRLSEEMNADLVRFNAFVEGLPLAEWDPDLITVTTSHPEVRAWGLAGEPGGIIWAQDIALEGQPAAAIRSSETTRVDITLNLTGMPAGTYTVLPYNTWTGEYLPSFELACPENEPCTLTLPAFETDIALKIER